MYADAIRAAYGQVVTPPRTGRPGRPRKATVNAAFVERHHGTDRGRCRRKGRKSYQFSKAWDVHVAATRFSDFTYNFCWPVRTLRVKGADGRWRPRTPAMAAKLTDHVWPLGEWITFPAVQRR